MRSDGRGGRAWRGWRCCVLYYGASRTFATRFLHTLLRGVSRDRLDLLGEEYFQYILKPRMRREAVETLVEAIRAGERVVLVSQLLDHILKPLAKHFGVESIVANRLEFRDGHCHRAAAGSGGAAARAAGVDCQWIDGWAHRAREIGEAAWLVARRRVCRKRRWKAASGRRC